MIGPVADDNTMETVQLYLTGILTVDEAVAEEAVKPIKKMLEISEKLGL